MKPVSFLLMSLMTAALLLAGVYGFNQRYDFGHIFSAGGFYQEMAKILKAGKFVYGIENCDLRALKEAMIQEGEVPDIVAIGSSTLMELHQAAIGAPTFLNAWVSGGNSQDIGAVAGAYLYHQGRLPKRFILAVEPWYFEYKGGGEAWKSWQFYLYYLKDQMLAKESSLWELPSRWWNKIRLGSSRLGFLKFFEGMSYGVTRYNIEHLLSGASAASYEISEVFKRHPAYLVFHPDGSLSESLLRDQQTIVEKKLFNLPRWNKFSEQRLQEFQELIVFLQTQGAEVVFYFPPWHPRVYQKLAEEKKEKLFSDVERIIRDFAEAQNIPVLGSYDPGLVGWGEAAFKDAHHSKEPYLKNLFLSWNKSAKENQIGGLKP